MKKRTALAVAATAALGAGGSLAATSAATSGLKVSVTYSKRPCGDASATQVTPAPVTAGTVELDRAGNGQPVRVSLLDNGTAPASVSLAGHGPISATLVLETPRVRVIEGAAGSSAQRIALGTHQPNRNGVVSFSVGRSEERNGHVNTLIQLQRAARVAAATAPRQLPLVKAHVHDGPVASRPDLAFDKPDVIQVGRVGGLDSQWEATQLAHEYAHFLLHVIAPDDPAAVGDHSSRKSYPRLPGLAWTEGFSHAFAAVVEGRGLLLGGCQRIFDLGDHPAGPPLETAEDKRYAQYSETRVGGATYQLIGHLGGGQAGLKRLLAALPGYRRAGHSVWTARDLRDLAVQRFEQSAADHAAIDRIFFAQGISWFQSIAVGVDRLNLPQEVAASSEIVVRVTGPGGFDCTPQTDIDSSTSSKLDGGLALGEKVADGGLSYSADDDCYLISGDGMLPDEPDPRAHGAERATVPFPYLSGLAHWTGEFKVLAKYVCEFDDRFGPHEVFQCPTTASFTAGVTSLLLLSVVPALATPTPIRLTRNAETTVATFTADGKCQIFGAGTRTDCGTSLP